MDCRVPASPTSRTTWRSVRSRSSGADPGERAVIVRIRTRIWPVWWGVGHAVFWLLRISMVHRSRRLDGIRHCQVPPSMRRVPLRPSYPDGPAGDWSRSAMWKPQPSYFHVRMIFDGLILDGTRAVAACSAL